MIATVRRSITFFFAYCRFHLVRRVNDFGTVLIDVIMFDFTEMQLFKWPGQLVLFNFLMFMSWRSCRGKKSTPMIW